MSHPVFRRSGLAPEPGSAELVVDFMDEDTLFRGPQVFYLVVRFPAGTSAGAGILLDTDQDYGLYPGTNYLSAGGGPFLGFEQAAGAVRPAFHGLDTWSPPGIAGDQLAMGMFIFTDSLSVPVYPPAVKEITCPGAGDREQGLSVQLEVLPAWSDGRPLDFTPRKIRVTHLLPGGFADSLVAEPDLDQEGRIVIRGLEQRPFLLRFAVLGPDGRPGQPSGAYYVLPSDPDEPNDSRQEAAGLEWAAAASGLWSEARTGPAVVRRAADFDFYRLALTAGDSLVAGFEGLAGSLSALNPVLSLTDSSGLVLEHDTGSVAGVSLTAPYSGDYYLLVNDRAVFQGEEFTNGAGRIYSLAARLLRRRGDVDGSDGIDYRDAFLVFVMTSGLRDTLSFTPAQRFAADFDGDGLVAGDISDFLGVLYQAGYLPGRDPGGPSKSKAPGPAQASAETWRLVFADGSSLLLLPGPAVMLETPGGEAGSLLRLLETAGDAQARAKTSQPAAPDRPASLGRNFPNPFNPSTTLCFSLQRAGPAELDVFDVRGRLVRSLFRGHAPAGQSSVVWDGTDSRGRQAASGVYFYRLRAEGVTRTRKMLLLK